MTTKRCPICGFVKLMTLKDGTEKCYGPCWKDFRKAGCEKRIREGKDNL